jgi:hypothetical protein
VIEPGAFELPWWCKKSLVYDDHIIVRFLTSWLMSWLALRLLRLCTGSVARNHIIVGRINLDYSSTFALLGLGSGHYRQDRLIDEIHECTELLNLLALVAPVDAKTTYQDRLAGGYFVDIVCANFHPCTKLCRVTFIEGILRGKIPVWPGRRILYSADNGGLVVNRPVDEGERAVGSLS